MISDQSLLLSTIVLNESTIVLNDMQSYNESTFRRGYFSGISLNLKVITYATSKAA